MATKSTKGTDVVVPDGVIVTRVGTVHASCEYAAVCGRFEMQHWGGLEIPLVDLDSDKEWDTLSDWMIEQGYRSPAPCSICMELVRRETGDDSEDPS